MIAMTELFGPDMLLPPILTNGDTNGTPDLERRVGSRDPETSWDAARITKPDANAVRNLVVLILHRSSEALTDDQIFAAYRDAGGKRTPQRVRTARAELTHPKVGPAVVVEFETPGVSALNNASRRWVLK